MTAAVSTMSDLRHRQHVAAPADNVVVGLTSIAGFDLAQRAAKLLAASTLVPQGYQDNLPNCVIALNMAARLNADPLMIMQNLVIVHGRPTWSAQFLIATVNTCGRFSALRYEFFGTTGKDDWGCRAWAVEKATGEKLVGTDVTIAIAKAEGWYGKNGSKWKSIPQQMLMYRAASWWTRAYAPELSMGLMTNDEARDVVDLEPDASGAYTVTSDDLRVAREDIQRQADGTAHHHGDAAPQAEFILFGPDGDAQGAYGTAEAFEDAFHVLLNSLTDTQEVNLFAQANGGTAGRLPDDVRERLITRIADRERAFKPKAARASQADPDMPAHLDRTAKPVAKQETQTASAKAGLFGGE